jgi:hypothetical protein
MADFAGYPMCKNGDVLIILSAAVHYQVHAELLKRHCRYFSKTLTNENALISADKAKRNGAVRWKFQLQQDHYEDCQLIVIVSAFRNSSFLNNRAN